MLNTYEKLADWIKENVSKKDRGNQRTIAKVAIWFVCNQEAETIYGCTQRDMAALVQSGMKPTNTTEDVDAWLHDFYDAYGDEDNKEATAYLVEKLKDHFGI